MKQKLTYGLVLSTSVLIVACERAIYIPLNVAQQKVVVEMEIKNLSSSSSWLRLSKSGSVYEEADFETVSGAIVKVTDKDGNVFNFTESVIPGSYGNSSLTAAPNNSYDLSIVVDGQEITAHADTYSVVKIDTAYFQLVENIFGAFFGDTTDSIIELRYSFLDDGSRENYYIRRSSINGGDYRAVAFDDDLWNGQQVDGSMSSISPDYGDTIFTELMSVDRGIYKFFESLGDNTSSTTTPANPVSNISSNALGYFGVFLVDTATIIIPE